LYLLYILYILRVLDEEIDPIVLTPASLPASLQFLQLETRISRFFTSLRFFITRRHSTITPLQSFFRSKTQRPLSSHNTHLRSCLFSWSGSPSMRGSSLNERLHRVVARFAPRLAGLRPPVCRKYYSPDYFSSGQRVMEVNGIGMVVEGKWGLGKGKIN
jgi:hypothetical protein